MNTTQLKVLAQKELGYNEQAKNRFLSLAKTYLLEVAGYLGESDCVRVNCGGIAVSGEAMLHTDTVYVCMLGGKEFYYRDCKGRKDYSGGVNRWMRWADLPAPAEFARMLEGL